MLAVFQHFRVGEAASTVALADQISREFNVSDQGIDMEIELTNDAHEAIRYSFPVVLPPLP